MSGGVDSSVAAALLTRAGHAVEGVTLKLWAGDSDPEAPWQRRACCKVGIARHACDVLRIRHREVDLRDDFRHRVVNGFLDTYLEGRTPNPCTDCNARVKFAGLLALARAEGFDRVATGHYARIERTGTGAWRLLKGADPAKDQSYFLYGLSPADLPMLRFPLGALRKARVMELAREMGLPADEIAESQEICFVGEGDYRDFLAEERPEAAAPGEIVDTRGAVVGRHDGVAFHTIGQRRGLNLAVGRRVYVVATDPASRRVVVGGPEDLWADGLEAEQVHWLAPFAGGRVTAKIRYRGAPVGATAALDGDRLTLRFDAPQRAVTPGQRVVLYRGDVVLGGAVIARAAGMADPCAAPVAAAEAAS